MAVAASHYCSQKSLSARDSLCISKLMTFTVKVSFISKKMLDYNPFSLKEKAAEGCKLLFCETVNIVVLCGMVLKLFISICMKLKREKLEIVNEI